MYYHMNKEDINENKEEDELEEEIKQIFKKSRNNYGSRKIKKELEKRDKLVSRRRIARIMKSNALVSNYTVAQYKVMKSKCNEEKVENILDRQFNGRKILEVCVSDLTYERVGNKWCYVCLIIDLNNREIIGYSVGDKKDSKLVEEALYSIKYPLNQIELFHTDRGLEFCNKRIKEILSVFGIRRSLSNKATTYDNAVIEATNKIIKKEFIYQKKFKNIKQLKLEMSEYVYWYNNIRIHGSLGYQSPIKYKSNN